MPSGTINGTTANVNVLIKCEWSESNVNIANNTSDVTAVIKMCRNDYDTLYWTRGTASLDISIGGQTQHVNQYVSLSYSYGWVTVTTVTKTVPHDANGTKSCTISVSGSILDTSVTSISLSGSGTLTPIARASQPSTTNGTFGSAITINTNRASTSFTHTLTMTMGSHSETKTGVGASLSWTIPASWADTIPAATSNTLSISCITYNGSTNIGTKTTSCTATIPDSWKPTVSISKTLTNGGDNSQVLVNVTTVNLTANGTASTGTSISSYSWSGGTVSGTGASKTHSPTSAATFTYTVTATDRRGRTGTATVYATSESGVSSMSCAASVNFGSALAVTITRKKSSFTHNVTWQISSSYTNTATGQGTSASYTIPTSWAASVPAASSINMTVTVTTYNGSSSLGSVNKTVSVVVPSSWVPSFTLTTEAVSAFNGMYLKGVSKVKLTASSVAASTGSQIQSYQFTGNNMSKTATTTAASYNVTSDLLSVVGSNTYTVKVTDKRGRVTTKTSTITVTAYKAPTIRLSVGRYTSGGVSDTFGAYGRMTATGTWTALSGNSWTLVLKQKKKSASSYTTVNTYSNQTASSINKTSDLFAADVDYVYDCQATLTDAVGKSVTTTVSISTGKAIRDLYKDKVVSFFSTASEGLRTALGVTVESLLYSGSLRNFFNGLTYVPDKASADGLTSGWRRLNDIATADLNGLYSMSSPYKIPNGTDFNDIQDAGTYYTGSASDGATMGHIPDATAGKLVVEYSTGTDDKNSVWRYFRQRFYPFYTNQYYERIGMADGESSPTINWRDWYIFSPNTLWGQFGPYSGPNIRRGGYNVSNVGAADDINNTSGANFWNFPNAITAGNGTFPAYTKGVVVPSGPTGDAVFLGVAGSTRLIWAFRNNGTWQKVSMLTTYGDHILGWTTLAANATASFTKGIYDINTPLLVHIYTSGVSPTNCYLSCAISSAFFGTVMGVSNLSSTYTFTVSKNSDSSGYVLKNNSGVSLSFVVDKMV